MLLCNYSSWTLNIIVLMYGVIIYDNIHMYQKLYIISSKRTLSSSLQHTFVSLFVFIIKKYIVIFMTTHICIIICFYHQKVHCHLHDNTHLYHYMFLSSKSTLSSSWQYTCVSFIGLIIKKYVVIFHNNTHLYLSLFLTSKITLSFFMTTHICIILCF